MTMMSAHDEMMDEGLLDEVKKANEFPIIPAGKYPASVVKVENISDRQNETFSNGGANPLYGKTVYNLQVKLEGVSDKGYNELDGSVRTTFIKLTPARVTGVDKNGKEFIKKETQLAAQLTVVSGTKGQPFSAAIAWAEQNKFQVSISHWTTKDGEKKDQVAAISAL
jgi:hypothetical protein